jgi:hypothetical protein
MTREDFNKLMESAGRMQILEGGSPKAYGMTAGQVALNARGKITPEEGQARLDQLFRIQQPGRFESFTQAAEQNAKSSGLVRSGVLSEVENAGLNSAFSVDSPGEASTHVEQFTRAVLSARIKARGMKMSPDVDHETTDKYMKSIGADKETNVVKIGGMIADDLAKQEAEGKKTGKAFNAHDYLMQKGFGNMEDRATIMSFSGLRNSGRLDKITAAMDAPLDVGKPGEGVIDRRFKERVAKDPFLQNRVGEVSDQLATAKQGTLEEPWVAAQRAAFAKLKAQPGSGVTGEWKDFQNEGTFGRFTDSFWNNSHGKVEAEAERSLQKEAKRIGLNVPMNVDASGQGQTMRWSARDLARNVQQAGGNPAAGGMEQLSKVADQLAAAAQGQQKAAEAMERAAKAMGPKAIVPPANPIMKNTMQR